MTTYTTHTSARLYLLTREQFIQHLVNSDDPFPEASAAHVVAVGWPVTVAGGATAHANDAGNEFWLRTRTLRIPGAETPPPVPVGTHVYYHGSKTSYHGPAVIMGYHSEQFARDDSSDDSMRYAIKTNDGTGITHVRRQSFTVPVRVLTDASVSA